MLFLCRISVVRWFLFIFISNHPRATKRKIYAHPHLFWAIWICHGNSRRIAGSVWKSYLQTVSTRYLIAFWWHHIIIEGFFFFAALTVRLSILNYQTKQLSLTQSEFWWLLFRGSLCIWPPTNIFGVFHCQKMQYF